MFTVAMLDESGNIQEEAEAVEGRVDCVDCDDERLHDGLEWTSPHTMADFTICWKHLALDETLQVSEV